MHIYISGSLAFDRLMTFSGKFADHILPDKLDSLSVSFVGSSLKEYYGGNAANVAYTLALLEEKPTILSTAGKDFKHYYSRLEDMGLPMHGIHIIEDELTANCHITTDNQGNQITCFSPGAMNFRSRYDISGIDPADSLAIVCPGNLEEMIDLPRQYRTHGIQYIFDPGQNVIALAGEDMLTCIKGARALLCNEYELEVILKATGVSKGRLPDMLDTMIVTLGEKGAHLYHKGERSSIAAVKTQFVDPTGGGDAFRAGFLKGLVLGRTLRESAQMGSLCATYTIEQQGSQSHYFTLQAFWERYNSSFGSP